MRSAAQLVSYEIPGVLAALVPVMLAGRCRSPGSWRPRRCRRAGWASNWWFVFTPWGFLAFIVFLISGIAETNRTPFDLIEAESELAAGFHTEYSGMRFALFFLAEYANVFAVSAIGATLFLGWVGLIPFHRPPGPGHRLVPRQDVLSGLRLHVDSIHTSSTPLRSAHELRLEAAAAHGPGGRRDHRRWITTSKASWGREVGHARIRASPRG